MTSQFSHRVSEVLAYSREEATRLVSSQVGPEHLLLGILRDERGPVRQMLDRMHVSTPTLRQMLEQRIAEQRTSDFAGRMQTSQLVLNEKASNILKLAVLEARLQHAPNVDVPHLLLAILHDQADTVAKEVLSLNNIDYDDARTCLLSQASQSAVRDGIGMADDDQLEEPRQGTGKTTRATATEAQKPASKTPVLDNFSTDLTRAAAEGKLDSVTGREREMARVTEILCRRKKNNPILIGEPGVGKSAIVEGLAQMIATRKTSPVLFGKRVVSLDMTGLVAGTKYRGQFEERLRTLIKEIEQHPDIIVFIDEIHTMIGAGSTPGSMDAANIMKPALARGTIQCIGATTLDEYRNSIEKDGALERRFQKVLVEPTTAAETLLILQNTKDSYERHHHVCYTPEALEACVRLTARYVTDRAFPDKAIDALDEAGARVHLTHAVVPAEIAAQEDAIRDIVERKRAAVRDQNFERAAAYRDRQTEMESRLTEMQQEWTRNTENHRDQVTEADVADVVATMTGVPVQRIAEGESDRLRTLAPRLKESVVAQDTAVDKVVRAIQRNRMGLREPNHPIGVFMFLGPTGVGKTHLAKCLARQLFGSDDALIRIDMSEYSESFNTSRLVGAPPGYVGYDEGGQLTERVRRHPYSIVLLDEIEKAHGSVFNMLLQVLDEGRMTDGNGRLVDFCNTILIMTSNTGTRQLREFGRGIGFGAGQWGADMSESDRQHARAIIQKSLSRQFAPEFLNRLDDIITFEQLDRPAIRRIVDIELASLSSRIEAQGYRLEVTADARDVIASRGYDVQFGARPLKRAIQEGIEDEVAALLLAREIPVGSLLRADRGETGSVAVEVLS